MTGSFADTLRQKYNLLKKRVREIEEVKNEKCMHVYSSTKVIVKDNDAIHLKLTKAMRQIKRLRVERM